MRRDQSVVNTDVKRNPEWTSSKRIGRTRPAAAIEADSWPTVKLLKESTENARADGAARPTSKQAVRASSTDCLEPGTGWTLKARGCWGIRVVRPAVSSEDQTNSTERTSLLENGTKRTSAAPCRWATDLQVSIEIKPEYVVPWPLFTSSAWAITEADRCTSAGWAPRAHQW